MDHDERLREFNYRLMCFKIKAGRPLSLEFFGEYEDRVVERLCGRDRVPVSTEDRGTG